MSKSLDGASEGERRELRKLWVDLGPVGHEKGSATLRANNERAAFSRLAMLILSTSPERRAVAVCAASWRFRAATRTVLVMLVIINTYKNYVTKTSVAFLVSL